MAETKPAQQSTPEKPITKQQAPKTKRGTGGNIYLSAVSPIDVAMSIRHLSIMLRSGLALEDALRVLSEQTPDMRLRNAYADILTDIRSGNNVGDAMQKHPKIFSQIAISIIRIGEQGGTLESNLIFLADFLKKQYELQRKVKGALIYPMIVFGLTFVEMMGVIFFILPKLDSLFSTFDDLPSFTKLVLDVSKVVRENAVIFAVGLILTYTLIRILLNTSNGKKFKDIVGLKFPIIKRLNKNTILTTFSRTVAILLESGIPISKTLEIASDTIGNHVYKKILVKVSEEVKSGQTLATSLSRYPQYFPPTYVKMLEVGESTGSLEETLKHMYDFYQEEVEDMTDNLTTLLEPILLIFIGAMIGFLAIIIIAPIYQLTGNLN